MTAVASLCERLTPVVAISKDDYSLVSTNAAAAALLCLDADALPLPSEAFVEAGDVDRFSRAVDERPSEIRLRLLCGATTRVCVLHFDPTQTDPRVLTIEDITQSLTQSKMANLGALLAGAAHDISTPLGAIKANTELTQKLVGRLQKKLPEDDSKVARSVRALDTATTTSLLACERIMGIVGALRAYLQHGESGRGDVDVHEVLDGALLLCSHAFKNRIEVTKDYAALETIVGNAAELSQVFMNLLINAAQAIGDSGAIAVRTRLAEDSVVIDVGDDGSGIAAADLARIFDVGFTTKGAGTGVGLSIARRIARDHGGSIGATSTPGEGSTFTVTLPR